MSQICLLVGICKYRDFPGSDGEESACSVGDLGLVPGLGRSPGEGNGYPLQGSYLENSMDREVWWSAVHGATKSRTGLRLSTAQQHDCNSFFSL